MQPYNVTIVLKSEKCLFFAWWLYTFAVMLSKRRDMRVFKYSFLLFVTCIACSEMPEECPQPSMTEVLQDGGNSCGNVSYIDLSEVRSELSADSCFIEMGQSPSLSSASTIPSSQVVVRDGGIAAFNNFTTMMNTVVVGNQRWTTVNYKERIADFPIDTFPRPDAINLNPMDPNNPRWDATYYERRYGTGALISSRTNKIFGLTDESPSFYYTIYKARELNGLTTEFNVPIQNSVSVVETSPWRVPTREDWTDLGLMLNQANRQIFLQKMMLATTGYFKLQPIGNWPFGGARYPIAICDSLDYLVHVDSGLAFFWIDDFTPTNPSMRFFPEGTYHLGSTSASGSFVMLESQSTDIYAPVRLVQNIEPVLAN